MEKVPDSVGRDVLFEVVDRHVAVATLNRPAVRNAVDGQVTIALGHIVKRVESDPDIRVAILASSSDRAFCAGADLREIAQGRFSSLFTADGGFAGFMEAPRSKPWLAAVAGDALAGGCEIALCCDMIVAEEGSRFGLPEARRGLLAGLASQRLPRLIPRNIALEMLTTGEPIDAARAASLGLVNRLVGHGEARSAAIELAKRIAACAPLSVRGSLAVARLAAGSDPGLAATLDAVIAEISSSEDAREGPLAFVEKRAPAWLGR